MSHTKAMAGALKAALSAFGQCCDPVCEHARTWSFCQLSEIAFTSCKTWLTSGEEPLRKACCLYQWRCRAPGEKHT